MKEANHKLHKNMTYINGCDFTVNQNKVPSMALENSEKTPEVEINSTPIYWKQVN